jgi:hypothetical protein
MPAPIPSSLDSTALALRLAELAGEEREVQADFLLHLAVFDARRAYLELGHSSLWSYCLEVLHLREGAAGRRIGAMRVLFRFPRLEAALRDGRLSLSTIIVLGPVLTEENLDALLARAAFRTKREVEELVVSLRPRPAPAAGIRKLPVHLSAGEHAVLALDVRVAAPGLGPALYLPSEMAPEIAARAAEAAGPRTVPVERRRAAELQAVAQDRWSMRATVDRAFRDDLETLRCLLAHKVPDGDLTKVLHEAIRCAVNEHGKRRGAVAPKRSGRGPEAGASGAPRARRSPRTVAVGGFREPDPASHDL